MKKWLTEKKKIKKLKDVSVVDEKLEMNKINLKNKISNSFQITRKIKSFTEFKYLTNIKINNRIFGE